MPAMEELEIRARARVGSLLKDKWHLDALLGIGGMATVYSATHRNLKRAAIKMLHPELSSSNEMRSRFKREGYVANSVAHRGVVRVDDDDVTDDGAAFLVMELLEGETLACALGAQGQEASTSCRSSPTWTNFSTCSSPRTRRASSTAISSPRICSSLRDGTLKVLDFGIARVRELSTGHTGATRQGTLMGTPAFMAPEQARGRWEFVDEQTDIWAVGATMFTLLSGHFVYEGETENEQLALACTTAARSVAAVAPDLPKGVAVLIDRALAYDKTERWPSARAMLHELRTVAASPESRGRCGFDVPCRGRAAHRSAGPRAGRGQSRALAGIPIDTTVAPSRAIARRRIRGGAAGTENGNRRRRRDTEPRRTFHPGALGLPSDGRNRGRGRGRRHRPPRAHEIQRARA